MSTVAEEGPTLADQTAASALATGKSLAGKNVEIVVVEGVERSSAPILHGSQSVARSDEGDTTAGATLFGPTPPHRRRRLARPQDCACSCHIRPAVRARGVQAMFVLVALSPFLAGAVVLAALGSRTCVAHPMPGFASTWGIKSWLGLFSFGPIGFGAAAMCVAKDGEERLNWPHVPIGVGAVILFFYSIASFVAPNAPWIIWVFDNGLLVSDFDDGGARRAFANLVDGNASFPSVPAHIGLDVALDLSASMCDGYWAQTVEADELASGVAEACLYLALACDHALFWAMRGLAVYFTVWVGISPCMCCAYSVFRDSIDYRYR